MPKAVAFFVIFAVIAIAALSQFDAAKPFSIPLVGGLITLCIFWSTRYQAKRQVVLDLHKEYYSETFALSRAKAERFLRLYNDVDWKETNPYRMLDPKDDRPGYAAVVRYWHRVAILYKNNQLDVNLAHDLMARDLGFWYGRLIEPMRFRDGMYTLDDLLWLVDMFKMRTSGRRFNSGYADALKRRASPSTRAKRWIKGDRRWTKTGDSPLE